MQNDVHHVTSHIQKVHSDDYLKNNEKGRKNQQKNPKCPPREFTLSSNPTRIIFNNDQNGLGSCGRTGASVF